MSAQPILFAEPDSKQWVVVKRRYVCRGCGRSWKFTGRSLLDIGRSAHGMGLVLGADGTAECRSCYWDVQRRFVDVAAGW